MRERVNSPKMAVRGCVSVKRGFRQFLVVSSLIMSSSAWSAIDLDIRLGSAVGTASQNEAILRVSDCAQVANVDLSSGATSLALVPADASRVDTSSTACEFSLLIPNAETLDVGAQVTAGDGSVTSYSESFLKERSSPIVSLAGVGVQTVDARQSLVVQLDVAEDVDIRHLDVSASALRASDLRASDGLVDDAAQPAPSPSRAAWFACIRRGTIRVGSA